MANIHTNKRNSPQEEDFLEGEVETPSLPAIAEAEDYGDNDDADSGSAGSDNDEDVSDNDNNVTESKNRKYPSPLSGIRMLSMGKWYEVKTHTFYTNSEILDKVTKFVHAEARRDHCVDAHGRETKCSCIHDVLAKNENGDTILRNCANALFYDYYRVTSPEASHRYLSEQIRHADAFEYALDLSGFISTGKRSNAKKFLIPSLTSASYCSYSADAATTNSIDHDEGKVHETDGGNSSTNEENNKNKCKNGEQSNKQTQRGPFLCKWAFGRLHSLGRLKFKKLFCNSDEYQDTAPVFKKTRLHGTNNRSKKFEEAYSSIHTFLEDLLKIAEPITNAQRDALHITSKDRAKSKKVEVHLLPPDMTISSIYRQWAYTRGWVVKSKKGRVLPTSEWEKREHDEYEWPVGSEQQIIVAIRTFRRIWEDKFPNLCVRDHNTILIEESRTLKQRRNYLKG